MAKEKTINEWDESERETRQRVRHEFVPLSPKAANKWLLDGDVEVINNPFDDPPEATAEAEPGATIYMRVPAALKRRVDEAAEKEKLSGNIWAKRCVEKCLGGTPWNPIETAPHDGTRILLGFAHLQDIVLVGCWVNDAWEWTTKDTLNLKLRPTHWQPLLPPSAGRGPTWTAPRERRQK